MLQVHSALKLNGVEASLRQAAQHHGAQVLSVIHLGHLLKSKRPGSSQDVIVFNLCHPDLGAALLSSDIRFCAYLPCRIAAYETEAGVTLQAISPVEGCRLLDRPDLERMAMLLEATLAGIMQAASQPLPAQPHHLAARHGAVGATEGQVNVRGSIPQRIDCHGTKIEELGGTGQHDAAGG
jgi:uncharacterized protein (DUF302 family)